MAQQQQTVLRVQTNNAYSTTGITQYEFLDLYGDVPIKINKSYAELQDIGKRNSDYSIGLTLPGSKKNNTFFESYFNVDVDTLYFNPLLRVNCDVLLNDQQHFSGYLRLNKVSVLNSKTEYDVTLYSTVADLFGKIGNNLLRDLNYADTQYTFNHTFSQSGVTENFDKTNFAIDGIQPEPYIYPIVHNGYEYSGDTVNLSGATTQSQTRLYTSTSNTGGTLNSYSSTFRCWEDGNKQYRINSPGQGLLDNQLKPALSIWNILKLMFKTYGYTISSDFFKTPWFKTLYLYGYFSSEGTKFSYKTPVPQVLPLDGVEIIWDEVVSAPDIIYCEGGTTAYNYTSTVTAYVVKAGTGIPALCSEQIDVNFYMYNGVDNEYYFQQLTIPRNTTGNTFTYNYGEFFDCTPYPTAISDIRLQYFSEDNSNVSESVYELQYLPSPANTLINFVDGDPVDFSLVIDENIKQIDILSSVAKKFNLVFVPDPEVQNQIIIEPYNYYMGTGQVYDWTDKISHDKGFTVEPALNFIESELILSDLEDGDYGNKEFKDRNKLIYGENRVYNPTDFKSQTKKIDTIFSAEVIRKWDENIAIPLGINYAGSTSSTESGGSEAVSYYYKGLKSKPKLFFWLGGFNPFLDIVGETYNYTYSATTYTIYVQKSNGTDASKLYTAPVISHTMPIGNPDGNKINNDSICELFNSQQPTDIGVSTYNAYTDNDAYNLFYANRVNNLYDPNTRFLNGYFNLKYTDIVNLKPNDIIRIKQQYFQWNKIDSFNLTNRELTKVELIQTNVAPQVYPTRYFQYFYCDQTGTTYNFKTDFSSDNLLNTNFGWSVLYDYSVGTFSVPPSGYTSTFKDTQSGNTVYVPYYIYEITEDQYNTTGLDWINDTMHTYIYSQSNGPFFNNMPTFWVNSGSTITGTNLFTDCAGFAASASSNGIRVGSSTYHGSTPPTSIYHSGVTLNITDTGWIKYNSSDYPTGTYQYMGSLGNIDLGGCVDCTSINYGFPFSDLAAFTVVDCGTACP
jgi:hypothetical protein